MATKAKATLLFIALLLFASTLALSSRGEEEEQQRQRRQELEQCKQDCQQQGQQERWQCEQQCRQKYKEERHEQGQDSRREEAERRLEQCQQQCHDQGRQERYQCEQQCQQRYEEETQDPQRRLEQCKQECRDSHQGGQQQEQWQCERQCQQQYEEQRQEKERESTRSDRRKKLEECRKECQQWQQGGSQRQLCELQCEKQWQHGQEGEEEERTKENPYVFKRESFMQSVRSEQGYIRILQNFAQKSKLLIGIADYRLTILEANPNTFVMPTHFDADLVFYVVRGEGTVTLVKQDEGRESYNIKQGDIMKVSSGTIMYLINRSNNQKLQIVSLLQPVFAPGQFEEFYTVGGEEPQSFYKVFNIEILEAALNARRDQLEGLFGQQRAGVIIKISPEQISALSHHSSSSDCGCHRPSTGGESEGPCNLLNDRPTHSNKHGSLREANSNDYKPLKDLNIQVSFANITGGSMMAPFYNSRATKIAIVTKGRGYFEMASPYLSRQQGGKEQEGQRQYEKVQSQVSEHTVFVLPPGRPIAIMASKEQNLELVCFELNAERNKRTFIAGKDNVVSKMEREAKELAFGVPSKLVDEVFGGQQEEVFVRGPEQTEKEEERRRHPYLESILNFAARF